MIKQIVVVQQIQTLLSEAGKRNSRNKGNITKLKGGKRDSRKILSEAKLE